MPGSEPGCWGRGHLYLLHLLLPPQGLSGGGLLTLVRIFLTLLSHIPTPLPVSAPHCLQSRKEETTVFSTWPCKHQISILQSPMPDSCSFFFFLLTLDALFLALCLPDVLPITHPIEHILSVHLLILAELPPKKETSAS